ncbi:hypothetical protein COO60DRAFT_1120217 [Scenedesmus sp. NREL 46B-D3]|nr:hypothetical protein COO60DRAFT_1120217 [Scenedesmus sp. NREL 46B-D3]
MVWPVSAASSCLLFKALLSFVGGGCFCDLVGVLRTFAVSSLEYVQPRGLLFAAAKLLTRADCAARKNLGIPCFNMLCCLLVFVVAALCSIAATVRACTSACWYQATSCLHLSESY